MYLCFVHTHYGTFEGRILFTFRQNKIDSGLVLTSWVHDAKPYISCSDIQEGQTSTVSVEILMGLQSTKLPAQ